MDTSLDSSKKVPIEELSKEELLKKYRSLLNILQKAKQAKESLTEENTNLKSQLLNASKNEVAEELIEKLTQQKLTLVTSLDEIKSEKNVIHEKLKNAEDKITELDIENQTHRRQINRLTEENEQLLNHLDSLSAQTDELKKIGLEQQRQLLELEKQGEISSEILLKSEECETLRTNRETLINANKELSQQMEVLKNKCGEYEGTIKNLKATLEDKTKQNDSYINTTDDLNIELHKNKALVEKLQQDIVTMTSKMSSNQIESSCVESDLLNINEKLKEKLKFFHSKIVKFAGDVKHLKSEKVEVLNSFREYTEQVKLWETQLHEFSNVLIKQFEEYEQNQIRLKCENDALKLKITNFEFQNERLDETTDNKLIDSLDNLRAQIQNLEIQLEVVTREKNHLQEQFSSTSEEVKIMKDLKEREKRDLEVEIEQLSTQNAEIPSLKEEILNLIESVKEFSQNKEDLEKLKIEYHQMKTVLDKLAAEKQNWITEKQNFNADVNKLKSENEKLNLNVQELLQNKEMEILNLTESFKELTDSKEDLENFKVEYYQIKNVLDKLIEEKQSWIVQKQAIDAEVNILKSQKEQLNQELTQNKEGLEKLKLEYENILDKVAEEKQNWITEKQTFDSEVNILKKEKDQLHLNFQELQQNKEKEILLASEINLKLDEQVSNLSAQIKNLTKENDDLSLQISKLEKINNSHSSESENYTKLQEEFQTLQMSLNTLSQEKQELLKLKDNLKSEVIEMKEQVIIMKNENSELLLEMNQMNQALKERGETISKQQEYFEEILKNAKVQESQNAKLMEAISQKEEIIAKFEQDMNLLKDQSVAQSTTSFNEMHTTISKKNEEISQLQHEIAVLKEKLLTSLDTSHDTSNYAESETMSTSTISKSEDVNRLKDLEGSWEEKYGKLRGLAIKLKGKIRELSGEISKEQEEKAEVYQKLVASQKNVQTMQSQCDKFQDELEQAKKEIQKLSKQLNSTALDISNNKKQLADNEELIGKLKSDIDAFNKEKEKTENWKKQVSGKIQNLRKEVDAHNVLKKDFESQIAKLNSQLEAKEKSLNDEIERHNTTRNSLQEINSECKKQSVLNLEMQDYERSLKDLTQKLEKKQELITKLKNQLDSQRSSVNNVKEQNRLLEDRILHEEVDLSTARNEIQAYKKKLSDLETTILQREENIQNLMRTLEGTRAENEDLSVQLSKSISENQKNHGVLKGEKDYLESQNISLEQKIRELTDSLKQKEDELQQVNNEFHGYKVRAQSVFRQNQTRDIGMEEKLSEEIVSFKAQIGILQSELEEMKATLKETECEGSKLRIEKSQIELKLQNLEHKYEESRSELENLSAKHQKSVSEHAETVRSLKIHSETLAQCYRQQISEQEVRHNREIIELQSKFEKVSPTPEVPHFSPTTVPREQGEGSENVDIHSVTTSRPIPLDRLLSSDSDQDIDFIKKQVSENETKVAHLTALLSDTEQDLAKHVQMNKLLKEEIRRQQRSEEREKHAENLEYLKNVIFKFATLTSGDERSRLVPVLNTILKFSPEETNKLNLVAKGEYGSRGWSNYLPVWSSPGKPQ